jgi:tyrosyl-tRNA synthetase
LILENEKIISITVARLVHDIMPGTEEQLLKKMTTTYIGFDPTSDSCILGV